MEAAATVGGAILAPLVQSLLESLKSSDTFTYAHGSKVLEEVSNWEPMLKTIFAVLDDVEEQLMTDGVVQSWFSDLRDLAYDVDDILDELITHAKQRKFHAETETSSSKVGKLLRSGLSFSTSVKFSSDMVSKVKKISQRLGDVKIRMDLPKNVGERNNRLNEKRLARPLPTTSLAEPKVRGREKDHKAILEMMKTEAGDGGISVISIVGMGGVGKTTLVQRVYNDESLQVDFKSWVSIGEDFDLIRVTKTIVQSEGDLDSLQLKLREKLSGKKFLVILDDLWSDDYETWTRFYRPFASGAPGSRIIITTRNKEVSLVTSTHEGYLLQSLSYDDSLSLFAYHALGKEDFTDHMDLMEVGQQIVKKCDGLPLAVKALGGLLRGKSDYNVWKNLMENKLWGERSKLLPALRLSYYNLPPHLKRCFAYCAIFPKEYEFVRGDLVLLWLAEGFLQQLNQGYDYFDELFARSLFQKSAKDASVFVMHDLTNDLARSVSGGVCLNLDEERCAREFYADVRHSAFNRGEFDIALRFENFQLMKRLRTLLALPIFRKMKNWEDSYVSSKVLEVWIPKLKCLRVLSLSGYKRVDLPKSIDVLQHLRYLNIWRAEIVTLPESVCKLFNLQVLILRNCKNLRKLPRYFCNLINLQFLDLRGTDSLEEMPLHIGNLSKLYILTKFIVGSTDGRRIQELLRIPNLQGQVHVKELQNMVSMEVKDCLRMKEKEKIDGLVLEWTSSFDVFRDEENEKQVFEVLQPQKNITQVSIKSYGGTKFPLWFGNESFKMTVLEIYNCRNISSLPPFGGLPSLKELSIEGMPGVKEVGVEFYGVVSSSYYSNMFPSLEILNFKDMKNWKSWSCFNNVEYEVRVFSKLKKLGIRSCPELVGNFPKSLHSLEELTIEGCKEAVLKHMPNLESLTKLEIGKISGRVSFSGAFPKTLNALEVLEVERCDEVQHLWENGTKLERLACLKLLKIGYCAKLVSLVEGEEGIFPPNLQLLDISSCDNLERLPNQLHSLTSLTTLWIDRCPKLATFGDLPDNVKDVEIRGCDSMERLPEGIMVDQNGNSYTGKTSRIEELELRIMKPDSLIIPSNEVFPTSLRSLSISEGLETQLLGSLQLQNHLSHLTELYLKGSWESFPATGLPIPTLLYFQLYRCGNLRSLPCNLHNLTSLENLCLHECPKIESFPERGMPPNLSHLVISLCGTLERRPLSMWRLNRLSCLQVLVIKGAMEMVSSFPHDSLPLPTSLTTILINGFQNLKSISSGLRRLTSLQKLDIWNCPKLQSLPKEGLPPSLGRLRIGYCPLLEKQCKTGEGKYHARIPDFRYISDPTVIRDSWKDDFRSRINKGKSFWDSWNLVSIFYMVKPLLLSTSFVCFWCQLQQPRQNQKAKPLKSTVCGQICYVIGGIVGKSVWRTICCL